MWKHELENESFLSRQDESFLEIKKEFVFEFKSMHGQQIPGNYHVELEYIYEGQKQKAEVREQTEIYIGDSKEVAVKCEEGRLIITVNPGSSPLGLCSIKINQDAW